MSSKITFSIGGVHPDDAKLARACATEVLPLPEVVYVSMAQHLGAPAKPVVSVGDYVKAGQVNRFKTCLFNLFNDLRAFTMTSYDTNTFTFFRNFCQCLDAQTFKFIYHIRVMNKLAEDKNFFVRVFGFQFFNGFDGSFHTVTKTCIFR